MKLDDTDRKLIDLLSANSRESITELSRIMNMSRSTVQDRIEKLEHQGIIRGYTVRLSDEYLWSQVVAHVMINTDQKQSTAITRDLKKVDEVKALHTVNGIHDMIAIVSADSTQTLDKVLDKIGAIEGIEKTESSIVLSTRFER